LEPKRFLFSFSFFFFFIFFFFFFFHFFFFTFLVTTEETFCKAAWDGKAGEVEGILRNNPTFNVNWRSPDGSSALLRACQNGHDSVVSILLAHPDIAVNLKDTAAGDTSFFAA